ncbi:hypothetical protein [Microbacterium immunditiarum]|uniref:Uncharacterized protein n=1 Tax=Microbacterium immunditiarum TaxID=337480 RepID=A0A7Y9GS08_9MICO|nr:hypothetical protein [Microbacterium immunditiarum]NYE20525.1 hypothetical protein [Microbacterium immunditiarum]
MPANVTESRVEVYVDTLGIKLDKPRKTTGYTAWCDECTVGESGINWHGPTYPVGYYSAPTMEAVIDAEQHNEQHDPTHIVRVSELAHEPTGRES